MGMVGSDNTREQLTAEGKKPDGTVGIGGGLVDAVDVINQRTQEAFAKHNAQYPSAKEASYAAELGAQLASHAKDAS